MKQVEVSPNLEWEQILEQVKTEDVVLTRQGHAVALLSDFDDDDLYWYARAQDPAFLASLQRASDQVEQGKIVSHEELKNQLGIE